MKGRYRRILNERRLRSESSSSIIGVLRLLAQDQSYDFALLAVRFGQNGKTVTEFIIANDDPQQLLVSKLEQLRARGGEPIGFIHLRVRRPESDSGLMQIDLPLEQMFSLYQTIPLPQFESDRNQKAYLANLTCECAPCMQKVSLSWMSQNSSGFVNP